MEIIIKKKHKEQLKKTILLNEINCMAKDIRSLADRLATLSELVKLDEELYEKLYSNILE